MFEDLFGPRGRPSVPADVMATVMVLQALQGLSDRDAVGELRSSIAWKVATGLSLADEGFHPTVLTLWRNKLRASPRPERIFEAVRAVIDATGILAGKTRRALDSTVLDDAVATQDTVTQLIAAVRRVRRVVPGAAEVELSGHDYDRAGKPVIAWDDLDAKNALVSALVVDARRLGDAFDQASCDGDAADALGLLALIAGQDVEPGEIDGTWRIARRVAADRIVSTVDVDSRHAHKTRRDHHDGYKAHVAVEPSTGLVTGHKLTAGNTHDGPTGIELARAEPAGVEIYADTAYSAGATRAALRQAGHDVIIKPHPLPHAVPGGFTRDDFTVDHHTATVTCPAGLTASISPKGFVTFGARCTGCPLRARCTTAPRGRTLEIKDHNAELVYARAAWNDPLVVEHYRTHRPMVERTLAWLVAKGNRRLRYRGTTRNQAWLATRLAALNLRRLITLGLDHNGTTWTVPTA